MIYMLAVRALVYHPEVHLLNCHNHFLGHAGRQPHAFTLEKINTPDGQQRRNGVMGTSRRCRCRCMHSIAWTKATHHMHAQVALWVVAYAAATATDKLLIALDVRQLCMYLFKYIHGRC